MGRSLSFHWCIGFKAKQTQLSADDARVRGFSPGAPGCGRRTAAGGAGPGRIHLSWADVWGSYEPGQQVVEESGVRRDGGRGRQAPGSVALSRYLSLCVLISLPLLFSVLLSVTLFPSVSPHSLSLLTPSSVHLSVPPHLCPDACAGAVVGVGVLFLFVLMPQCALTPSLVAEAPSTLCAGCLWVCVSVSFPSSVFFCLCLPRAPPTPPSM